MGAGSAVPLGLAVGLTLLAPALAGCLADGGSPGDGATPMTLHVANEMGRETPVRVWVEGTLIFDERIPTSDEDTYLIDPVGVSVPAGVVNVTVEEGAPVRTHSEVLRIAPDDAHLVVILQPARILVDADRHAPAWM